MKQKQTGFSLVEGMIGIAIVALLLMISIPIVLKVLSDSSTKAYDKQVELIEKATQTYVTKNSAQLSWDKKGTTVVTLKQLQDAGYIDPNLIDTRDKKTMTCADIQVTKENDTTFRYTIDTETCRSKNKDAS